MHNCKIYVKLSAKWAFWYKLFDILRIAFVFLFIGSTGAIIALFFANKPITYVNFTLHWSIGWLAFIFNMMAHYCAKRFIGRTHNDNGNI